MKSYRKIAKSIIKKNKGLSIGIFLMSVAMIAVGILGSNVYPSTTDSVNSFIVSSNLPDKVYTTNILSASVEEDLMSIDGIKEVDHRFVINSNFELEQDGIFSGMVITYDENNLGKISFFEEVETEPDAVKSYLPAGFANRHKVSAGETLTIFTNGFRIETIVKGIVASPEALYGDRDFMAVHEAYSYTKLYVDVDDLDRFLHIKDKANQWLVYMDASLDEAEKESVLSQVTSTFGEENIISIKDFESSKRNLLSLKPNLEAVNTLGMFFAVLTVLLTLGFDFIFIQIIIKKERRTIGLLKSLGYKRKHIIKIFAIFTSLINAPAVLVGFPTAYLILRLLLLKLESSFYFPLTIVSISPLSIILLFVSTFLIGLLSSLLSSSQIGKIEPSEAYGGNNVGEREAGKYLKRLKVSKFSKLSLSSMIRSLGRQIVGSLCISACVLFMFISMEGYAAHSKVVAGGYGTSYTYDVMVRCIDEDGYSDIKDSITSYEIIEPYIFIDAETNFGGKRLVACSEDTAFIALKDENDEILSFKEGIIIDQFTAQKNNVTVGDSIFIFEKELKIAGIAIEYTSPISFINFETASYLGFDSVNGAMIKLKDGASEVELSREINALNSEAYVVRASDQKAYSHDRYNPVSATLIALGCIAFLIGTLLIVNISFIDFLELQKKYATLRALGTPMKKIIKISLFENGLRCLVGMLLALPLCFFSAQLLFVLLSSSSAYYAMVNFPLYFVLSDSICVLYLAISVLISYIGIKKLDFAHQLNSRE